MLRIRILVILGIFIFCGCAGKKAAHNLTALQLGQLIQYQSLLDTKISAEEEYYLSAKEGISKNLNDSEKGPLSQDFIDRHAIETEATWKQKKSLEENDLLLFVDRVSEAYGASLSEIHKQETRIAEEYLNSLEQVEFQRKKLQSVEDPLRKLQSGMSTEQQARFLFAYIKGVRKALDELNKKPDSNATTPSTTGTP